MMVLYILGAGKYGKEIENIAEQTKQFTSIRFLDDKLDMKLLDFNLCISENSSFYVALAIMS